MTSTIEQAKHNEPKNKITNISPYDTEKRTIVLVSNENDKIELPLQAAKRSATLAYLIGAGFDEEIEVLKASTALLQDVVDILTHYVDEPLVCTCISKNRKCRCGADESKTNYYRTIYERVNKFDRKYFCRSLEQVGEMRALADFLDIKRLYFLMTVRITSDFMGIIKYGTIEDMQKFGETLYPYFEPQEVVMVQAQVDEKTKKLKE